MPGYSGTPLAKKLGIKDASVVVPLGAPSNYRALLQPLPKSVTFRSQPSATSDVIHVFTAKRSELAKTLARVLAVMRPDAVLWVSWPKKAANVPTDIDEQTIRDEALPLGLVDIKVCAVDDTWSGLKLVIRKERRLAR
jgi:hypothetical protein